MGYCSSDTVGNGGVDRLSNGSVRFFFAAALAVAGVALAAAVVAAVRGVTDVAGLGPLLRLCVRFSRCIVEEDVAAGKAWQHRRRSSVLK